VRTRPRLLQAGAGLKGEFGNRLKPSSGVSSHRSEIILVTTSAHDDGAGGQAGGQGRTRRTDEARARARGEPPHDRRTTWAEYKKYFEKDAALAQALQGGKVEEPHRGAGNRVMMRGSPRRSRTTTRENPDEGGRTPLRSRTPLPSPSAAAGQGRQRLDTACGARGDRAGRDDPPTLEEPHAGHQRAGRRDLVHDARGAETSRRPPRRGSSARRSEKIAVEERSPREDAVGEGDPRSSHASREDSVEGTADRGERPRARWEAERGTPRWSRVAGAGSIVDARDGRTKLKGLNAELEALQGARRSCKACVTVARPIAEGISPDRHPRGQCSQTRSRRSAPEAAARAARHRPGATRRGRARSRASAREREPDRPAAAPSASSSSWDPSAAAKTGDQSFTACRHAVRRRAQPSLNMSEYQGSTRLS